MRRNGDDSGESPWHRSACRITARSSSGTARMHSPSPCIAPRGAFPSRVAPGLKAQLLRSVGSIAANIAEGAGHETKSQFAHFITIAIGSANEAETHLALAQGLNMLPDSLAESLEDEVRQIRRMLFGLRKHLQQPELH